MNINQDNQRSNNELKKLAQLSKHTWEQEQFERDPNDSFPWDDLIQKLNSNEYIQHLLSLIDRIYTSVTILLNNISQTTHLNENFFTFITKLCNPHETFLPFINAFSFIFVYLAQLPKYVFFIGACILGAVFYKFDFLFYSIVYDPVVFAYQTVAFITATIYYAMVYVSIALLYLVFYSVTYLIIWPLTFVFQELVFMACSKLFIYVIFVYITSASVFCLYQYYLEKNRKAKFAL